MLNVVYRETVGRFLCSLPVNIGYIVAGIDSEKRGFHDMLCDTRVVYQKKELQKTEPIQNSVVEKQQEPVYNGYHLVEKDM